MPGGEHQAGYQQHGERRGLGDRVEDQRLGPSGAAAERHAPAIAAGHAERGEALVEGDVIEIEEVAAGIRLLLDRPRQADGQLPVGSDDRCRPTKDRNPDA